MLIFGIVCVPSAIGLLRWRRRRLNATRRRCVQGGLAAWADNHYRPADDSDNCCLLLMLSLVAGHCRRRRRRVEVLEPVEEDERVPPVQRLERLVVVRTVEKI
jgi:hypothetical protein